MMSKDNDIVITFKTNLYFIADHDRKPTKKWCEQELSMPNKERGMTVSIFIQTVLISLRRRAWHKDIQNTKILK